MLWCMFWCMLPFSKVYALVYAFYEYSANFACRMHVPYKNSLGCNLHILGELQPKSIS